MLNLVIVHNKVHKPESCSFTYGCGLCRLKMSKSETRHILIFICKLGNACNSVYKFLFDEEKRLSHCDNISIITYITACCAEMDNRLCVGAQIAVCMNMAHYIVAEFLFIFLCRLIIDVLCVRLEFIYLFLSNIKTELTLRLSKSNPKLSPCFKLKIRRVNILHFLACIASVER